MSRFPPPGHHKTPAEFRAHLRAVDPAFDCVETPAGRAGPLGRPVRVFGREVDNRFAIHPMEGWDGTPDGLPTEHTLRRWRRFGEGGARLIWGGEAFAVRRDGRANPNQLFANPAVDVDGALAALRDAVRDGHRAIGEDPDRLVLGLQLTHSGRFARPDGALAPRIAFHHPLLDAKYGIDPALPVLTDGELEAIGEAYVAAAERAAAAGFAFVDVKCCHGYLMHELLSARDRPGRYGGDLAGRARLLLRTIDAVRSACPGLGIGVRLSAADTVPHHAGADGRGEPMPSAGISPARFGFGIDERDPTRFDLREPLELLRMLQARGVDTINVSLGSPYWNPHLQRPAAYPPSDGYAPPADPLAGVVAHLGVVRAIKAAVPDLTLVGTGYSYLQEWLPHVAEHELGAGHVDFVGIGRMALIYPDLIRAVLAGEPLDRGRICRTFSDCTTAPRNGMLSGCYPLDPYYKAMPEAQRLKELKRARARR